MRGYEEVKLKRSCEAAQIPSGQPVTLHEGAVVTITQSLGGSYTVTTEEGFMVRIAEKDADALGKEKVSAASSSAETGPPADAASIEKMVWERLKTCYDPEIPVNIVDLGLVYQCRILPLPDGGYRVEVKMTLTAPGCGMGGVLRVDAEAKILSIPNVKQTQVELVWEPQWDRGMMSDAAKLQLGMM